MTKEKTALYSELQGTGKDTFLYRLHEEDVWDEQAYKLFEEKCCAFLNCISGPDKKEDNSDIFRLLADRLAYISHSVFCHYSGSDLFVIKNWSERTEKKLIPDFFDSCRFIFSKMF